MKTDYHYGIEISDKRLKENIESILSASLIEAGILPCVASLTRPAPFTPVLLVSSTLTFEQQKELLVLQFEHDTARQRTDLELAQMWNNIEQIKLQIERECLA